MVWLYLQVLDKDTTCTICGHTYSSRFKVYYHVVTVHGDPYKCCRKCVKVFLTPEELEAHSLTHPDQPPKPKRRRREPDEEEMALAAEKRARPRRSRSKTYTNYVMDMEEVEEDEEEEEDEEVGILCNSSVSVVIKERK